MKKYGMLVCTVLVAAIALPVSAVTVQFEGYGSNTEIGNENVGDGLEVGASDGYEFTSSGDHFHFGDGLFGVPNNGTGLLLQDRDASIFMAQSGGGAFELLSFDGGEDVSFGGSATDIVVTGFFSGGGSISQIFALDGNSSLFENFVLAGFTNLSYVEFDGIGAGTQNTDHNGFTLDNINVNASAPVPEPATLSLLGMGLVGLVARARRKA